MLYILFTCPTEGIIVFCIADGVLPQNAEPAPINFSPVAISLTPSASSNHKIQPTIYFFSMLSQKQPKSLGLREKKMINLRILESTRLQQKYLQFFSQHVW